MSCSFNQAILLQTFEREEDAFDITSTIVALPHRILGLKGTLEQERSERYRVVSSCQSQAIAQIKGKEKFLLLPHCVILKKLCSWDNQILFSYTKKSLEKLFAQVILNF